MPAGEDGAVGLVEWVPAADGPGSSAVVANARDPNRSVKPLGTIRRHLGVSSRPPCCLHATPYPAAGTVRASVRVWSARSRSGDGSDTGWVRHLATDRLSLARTGP